MESNHFWKERGKDLFTAVDLSVVVQENNWN